jgi:hypothetical protein
MTAAYLIVTVVAAALNGFSGTAAVLRYKVILPGMAAAGVPESWLVFPIGTLKVAGAVGLLAGIVVPPIGVAAAVGLVLYFVCAIYTHIRAGDYSAQFGLACFFLALDAACLVLATHR